MVCNKLVMIHLVRDNAKAFTSYLLPLTIPGTYSIDAKVLVAKVGTLYLCTS